MKKKNARSYGEDKDQLISQFWDDADVENAPVVSNDRLTELDEDAFQQEVTRLQDMKVLRKAMRKNLTDDYTELSTTAVQDWRMVAEAITPGGQRVPLVRSNKARPLCSIHGI